MRGKWWLAGWLLCVGVALGKEETPLRDLGFRPLEIYEFKKGTGNLRVKDLDGDGRDDVVFANNAASRLEILLRRKDPDPADGVPRIEDVFENRGMIVDQTIHSLEIEDFTGDGRPDILLFGKERGLELFVQGKDGRFTEMRRIYAERTADAFALRVSDLDGDGRSDILLSFPREARILWNDPKEPFRRMRRRALSDSSSTVEIADVNNDGMPDLVLPPLVAGKRFLARVCPGKGDGRFGLEEPVELDPGTYSLVDFPGRPPFFCGVLRRQMGMRLYRFVSRDLPVLFKAPEILAQRLALEDGNRKEGAPWLVADFNGDGFDDLLTAAPALSRLLLYYGSAEGLATEPRRIDSLSGISRLDLLADHDVLVVSRKEKIVALHRGDDLDRFPAVLRLDGDVLAGGAVTGEDECWFVCKDEKHHLQLERVAKKGTAISTFPLKDLVENEPSDLLAFRLPDGRTGILLFMAYSKPRMLLFNKDGKLETLSTESFRALGRRLKRSQILLSRPGDGSELIVTAGNVARRFRWTGGGYEVEQQFNPEDPRANLVAAAHYSLADGRTGTVFYDRNAQDLVWFSAASNEWGRMHLVFADLSSSALIQLRNPSRDIFLLPGGEGLTVVAGGGSALGTEETAEYISPAEECRLRFLDGVELGAPPRPMLALLNTVDHSLELVNLKDEEAMEHPLIFEVFEASDFARGGRNSRLVEPREVRSGDLNGDGIGDLVLLCHDKLLVYLGE